MLRKRRITRVMKDIVCRHFAVCAAHLAFLRVGSKSSAASFMIKSNSNKDVRHTCQSLRASGPYLRASAFTTLEVVVSRYWLQGNFAPLCNRVVSTPSSYSRRPKFYTLVQRPVFLAWNFSWFFSVPAGKIPG